MNDVTNDASASSLFDHGSGSVAVTKEGAFGVNVHDSVVICTADMEQRAPTSDSRVCDHLEYFEVTGMSNEMGGRTTSIPPSFSTTVSIIAFTSSSEDTSANTDIDLWLSASISLTRASRFSD